ANIIFGATINPELEGELIITVVATGFDASYFSGRGSQPTDGTASTPSIDDTSEASIAVPFQPGATKSDTDMSGIDMDLEDKSPASDFKSDAMPNIWTLDDHHNETESHHDESQHHEVVTSSDIEGIEKPSFMRRLAKRVKESPASKKTDSND
ncbi:MAG TPA: hypothetical protein VFM05_07965, partial [Candidatus Saccharimonadales bacterium]|nr:hypothetical protein [Candidatus Saccharimonadales bacterium]